MFLTLLKGFTASAGLIVAIGAQNAFVLRQGMRRRHLFMTALCCSVIDAGLIMLGVLGFGQFIQLYPLWMECAKYFAVLFLLVYGGFSLRSAFQKKSLAEIDSHESHSLKKTVMLLLAFSLLNPHVYLDTVILLGSIASQQPFGQEMYFALGAMLASFTWFFGLTYGSVLLRPILDRPKCWRMIDVGVAVMMWAIGLHVLLSDGK
jgi:L-lysine exporter family protein LysE/ArgO